MARSVRNRGTTSPAGPVGPPPSPVLAVHRLCRFRLRQAATMQASIVASLPLVVSAQRRIAGPSARPIGVPARPSQAAGKPPFKNTRTPITQLCGALVWACGGAPHACMCAAWHMARCGGRPPANPPAPLLRRPANRLPRAQTAAGRAAKLPTTAANVFLRLLQSAALLSPPAASPPTSMRCWN